MQYCVVREMDSMVEYMGAILSMHLGTITVNVA